MHVAGEVTFTIPGLPVSANASRKPKAVRMVTPSGQKVYRGRMYKASHAATYQSAVYGCAMAAAFGNGWKRPYYAAVRLDVWNCAQDLDNVPKCVLDGMEGVFYEVDSRIKTLVVVPHRDKAGPRVVVTVRPMEYEEAKALGYIVPRAYRAPTK